MEEIRREFFRNDSYKIIQVQYRGAEIPWYILKRKTKFLWIPFWVTEKIAFSSQYLHEYMRRWQDWPPKGFR